MRALTLALAAAAVLVVAVSLWWSVGTEPRIVRPDEAHYVGRATCARCHAEEEALWTGSHHDLAMDVATEDTVLGDFGDARFEHDGIATTFRRDGERFVVHTVGADGVARDHDVKWVFGVEPLQQYLVEFEDGRVQCLRQAWDTEKGEWFALYPDEHVPPGDELFWTEPSQNWNWMCADCHSTGLSRGYDAKNDRYATTFEEIDVSCEACHGAGSEHVAWAESSWLGRRGVEGAGLTVRLDELDAEPELQSCAPCHSRRGVLLDDRPPGMPYHDGYRLSLLEDRLYELDGQVHDEVYVFGSFLQSRMYHEGVRCSDCHDPHSARLRFEGNATCTQCHVDPRYDSPAHHRHEVGSAGAACVACHMPERTYMVVDERRDHSFRVPRPDLTVRFGVPNACDACHAEEGAAWAAERIAGWTGREPYESPGVRQGAWAEAFSAARSGHEDGGEKLAALARDTTQPAIVRATALEELAAYGPRWIDVASAALDDPSPLVRAAAATLHEALPGEQRSSVARLAEDPVRRVRVEAARVLAGVRSVASQWREALDRATAEFIDMQRAALERPESWLMLGYLAHQRGQLPEAEFAYRQAIERDVRFIPARMNLAVLLDAMDRTAEAEVVLREVLDLAPDFAPAHRGLGLVLRTLGGREDEARYHLERGN